jgi:hypothetical protein
VIKIGLLFLLLPVERSLKVELGRCVLLRQELKYRNLPIFISLFSKNNGSAPVGIITSKKVYETGHVYVTYGI